MGAPDVIRHLAAAAPGYGIGLNAVGATDLTAAVPVQLADGSGQEYEIAVSAAGERASAREAARARLPSFCPIRHINQDGSFCLNWEAAESLAVLDRGTAEAWWGALLQYLRLQERARRLRRWPNRREWAHGEAAHHQRKAQVAAAALSVRFERDLAQGRVAVTRSHAVSAEGRALRLNIGGRRVLSVFDERGRAATLRQPCPCGLHHRPLTLRGCGDHSARFVELTRALRDQEAAERAFWKSWKGKQCCGTMDGCPLALTA
ncbi:E2 domain-containing protein [Methylorubrum extorquens]|uniref:Uncharacterized protein n=1 Tax=Methylorubrum extorquens (strain CM4 / NCIMB 13688) TaxID=440085 RepID=B7L3G4_METC4|nr:E2 domain-containing protein [Methylorubrum extorquens]ACK86372.1 conserved hypothetical protein [Methylorubrum extorquens CM4]